MLFKPIHRTGKQSEALRVGPLTLLGAPCKQHSGSSTVEGPSGSQDQHCSQQMFTEQEVQSTTKRALDLGECREPGEAEKNPKLAEAKKSRAQSSGSEPRVLLREECSRGSPLYEQRSRGQSGTALANSQRTAQGAAWEGSRFKRLRLSYV